jgi:Amino acid transporters
MNTVKKNVLNAIISIALMVGSSLLLIQTLNVYYHSLLPLPVISLTFLSVLLYVVGTIFMGRCIINEHRLSSSIVFALLLVATGMLLLGFNTGILPVVWKGFFFSWAMLLFIFGCYSFYKRNFIFGVILVASGMFFISGKIIKIYPDIPVFEQFFATYWPVGIVLLGVIIILSIIFNPKCFELSAKVKWKDKYITNGSENQDGKINYKFVFSGTEQVILDPVFKGGNIDVTFGGMELDLRHTSLAEGDTFLHINAVFGGVEITVPDNWDIEIRQNRFAGGIEDSRKKNVEKDHTRKLIIIAKCTFGGIDIK